MSLSAHLKRASLALLVALLPATGALAIDMQILATNKSTPILRNWMSPDVQVAWQAGFKGQGTTIIVVDDYTSRDKFFGMLDGKLRYQLHGDWTKLEASLLAPSATLKSTDFNSTKALKLGSGLNVINLSYGIVDDAGYNLGDVGFTALENSIISFGQNGKAVLSKAAGNDSVAVGTAASDGSMDYLNLALEGGQSVLFVGALDHNGTVNNKAALADYSNYAGSDPTIQSHFITVGVLGDKTGLYGTSFAAPVITGYASILGSKFKTATPTQITNQLLSTARQDTLQNYSADVYGVGEASLSRALAPVSIR